MLGAFVALNFVSQHCLKDYKDVMKIMKRTGQKINEIEEKIKSEDDQIKKKTLFFRRDWLVVCQDYMLKEAFKKNLIFKIKYFLIKMGTIFVCIVLSSYIFELKDFSKASVDKFLQIALNKYSLKAFCDINLRQTLSNYQSKIVNNNYTFQCSLPDNLINKWLSLIGVLWLIIVAALSLVDGVLVLFVVSNVENKETIANKKLRKSFYKFMRPTMEESELKVNKYPQAFL
ncbi:MAG: hypothetical protein MHPSP_002059 [Paramarteilia canceri]